ncbi:sensor histidine kinase [Agrobacterium vitis]|uniref:sensor histidine kinase n=1 Tax=Agrobacterium vitis TaxID=373 RepID=UPI003D2B10B9
MVALEQTEDDGFRLRAIPCRYATHCRSACRHLDHQMLDLNIFSDMDCVRYQRRRGMMLFALIAALLMAIGFVATYVWCERSARAALTGVSSEQLHQAITRIEREIDKSGILPLTVAMDNDVASFMQSSDRGQAIDAMGSHLAQLNTAAGTQQLYLVDSGGTVIASSNWRDSNSFVGRNISYRPYVQTAQVGKITGYYGIGTTGNAPGYYLATAVERDGIRLGVVAVKIDLKQIEADWLNGLDQPTIMTDANRVVVLSSRQDWKYHSLGPLAPEKLAEMNRTQQYNRHIMDALSWKTDEANPDGTVFVKVGDANTTATYLADTRFIAAVGMDLTVLSNYTNVKTKALERAAVAAILILLVALSIRIANQRRLTINERLIARDALQEAYTHLRQRFEDRNKQLQMKNEELRREVAERILEVKRSQAFQDELIRTENLAVIGQLSAGLAHEINQPLAALSTLSENAVRFLELDDTGTVRHNLERICDLVRRMGALTGQLRSFARRTDGETGPVDVAHSIESAIALLGHRLKNEQVKMTVTCPSSPIEARADAVRLEQVLVNLVSNAMDALSGNGEPKINITAHADQGLAIIDVADNGHGLSNAVQERLFEPFFTTKKTSGLGLGLAISQDIVRRFGGDLIAENGNNGGALFRVVLPLFVPAEKNNA